MSILIGMGFIMSPVLYLEITEDKRMGSRIKKKSEKTGETVSSLLMKKSSDLVKNLEAFAQEDAEEIRDCRYSAESLEKFSDSKNVFTKERAASLVKNVKNKGEAVFEAGEVTAAEWNKVFDQYRERLDSKVKEQKKITDSLSPDVLSKMQGAKSSVAPLQITADVDTTASVDSVLGDAAPDFKTSWESQFEELAAPVGNKGGG